MHKSINSLQPERLPSTMAEHFGIYYYTNNFLVNFESEDTKLAYFKDINIFLEFLSGMNVVITTPQDIKFEHIEFFKKEQTDKGLAPATINRRLGSIKSFLTWSVSKKYMKSMKLHKIKLPKISQEPSSEPLTEAEMVSLLNAPDTTTHKGRTHKLIMTLLFNLGLNRSEIVSIQMQHLTDSEQGLFIKIAGKTKARTIRADKETKSAIHWYIKYLTNVLDGDDFLIQTESEIKNTKPMDGSTVYRCVEKYAKALGIKKTVSPRTCRRTAITSLLEEKNLSRVALLTGTSQLTTSRYRENQLS